ncbi:unnamed protein product [Parajaminaea phylloscopi]
MPAARTASRTTAGKKRTTKGDSESTESPPAKAVKRTASASRKKAALSVNTDASNRNVDVVGGEKDDHTGSSSDAEWAERIKLLTARIDSLTSERDALRQSLDELTSLRHTTAESTLEKYKKASESRFKHSQDLVASLQSRLEVAEARAASGQHQGQSSSPLTDPAAGNAASEEVKKLKSRIEGLQKDKRKAEEHAKQLVQELQSATEAPKRLRLSDADHAAVRRLYEDLTGIAISRIEVLAETSGMDEEHRSFQGVFAAAGHHDLQLTFEESTPECGPDGRPQKGKQRRDLIYVPHLDEERDRALFDTAKLPEYLCEELPFDRSNGVAFLTTLTKALKK